MTLSSDPPKYNPSPCVAAVVALGVEPYVLVEGEVDGATVQTVEHGVRSAIRQAVGVVHVDLSGVTFMMASEGLRLLDCLQQFAAQQGCQIRFERPSRPVRRVIELGRLASLWGTSPGLDAIEDRMTIDDWPRSSPSAN